MHLLQLKMVKSDGSNDISEPNKNVKVDTTFNGYTTQV